MNELPLPLLILAAFAGNFAGVALSDAARHFLRGPRLTGAALTHHNAQAMIGILDSAQADLEAGRVLRANGRLAALRAELIRFARRPDAAPTKASAHGS